MIPEVRMRIDPAAGLADVRAAMQKHKPKIILFSGHFFMGSLVFEQVCRLWGVVKISAWFCIYML